MSTRKTKTRNTRNYGDATEKRQEKKYHDVVRLVLLAACLLSVLLAYTGVLYQTQVRDGGRYLEQSVRTITKTVSVEASRGNIVDRNGRTLVSNRSTYALSFDTSLLNKEDDRVAAVWRLLRLCRERGVTWTDNLPVSQTEPFVYTELLQDTTQRKRFCAWLQDQELISTNLEAEDLTAELLENLGLTADSIIARMRENEELSAGYSAEDARMILGVFYELELREILNNIDAYVFATDVDTELISILTDGEYKGIRISTSSVREYNTDSAAHILGTVGPIFPEELEEMKAKGYSGDATVGRSGVELAFEEYLRGQNGKQVVSTNADGKVTGEYYKTEPQPGGTVELTIDIEFQQQVEEILAQTVERMNAEDGDTKRGASAVVMKVGNGEILAIANYPTYSLATFNQDYAELSADEATPMLNRATQSGYAPGSTFKPCTAVAALQEGIITTHSTVQDTGIWRYPNYPESYAKCWIYPGRHGLINVTEAITVSCNYFFAEMGYQLGLDKLNEYALAFGLGEHTGIEIGDSAGVLVQKKTGEDSSPWAGFGQADYLFTPLQLANYAATLAADGKHYSAHLLKAVRSYDYTQILAAGDTEPVNVIDISPENMEAVKKGMLELTVSGSLKSYFQDCIVPTAAKTGTAQLTSTVKNNGVFICFAPYDDPEIAMAIVIERGSSGSSLASTAVEILNTYFSTAAQEQSAGSVTGEYQLLP